MSNWDPKMMLSIGRDKPGMLTDIPLYCILQSAEAANLFNIYIYARFVFAILLIVPILFLMLQFLSPVIFFL